MRHADGHTGYLVLLNTHQGIVENMDNKEYPPRACFPLRICTCAGSLHFRMRLFLQLQHPFTIGLRHPENVRLGRTAHAPVQKRCNSSLKRHGKWREDMYCARCGENEAGVRNCACPHGKRGVTMTKLFGSSLPNSVNFENVKVPSGFTQR